MYVKRHIFLITENKRYENKIITFVTRKRNEILTEKNGMRIYIYIPGERKRVYVLFKMIFLIVCSVPFFLQIIL